VRDTAMMCLLTDTPGAIGLRYDLLADSPGRARRITMTATGVEEDVLIDLEHTCVTCGTNEDIVRAGTRAVDRHGGSSLVVAAPVSAPTHATARVISTGGALRLAAVVATCDTEDLMDDLLGDDLLNERGLHLTPDDTRAVGQALAAQLTHADFILTPRHRPVGLGSELLDHVRAVDSHRVDAFTAADLSVLLQHEHHVATGMRRIDPLCVVPTARPTDGTVWTMTLGNDRPFHPGRLRHHMSRLALSGTFNRGHFWLATRPFTACAWEGVGGQLSIGAIGDWGSRSPQTKLAFTGTDPGVRQAMVEAFESSLLTVEEMAAGPQGWMDLLDDYDPWLGPRAAG
jgi:G3E family GTPase